MSLTVLFGSLIGLAIITLLLRLSIKNRHKNRRKCSYPRRQKEQGHQDKK